jgi:hypothetical protein
MADLPQSTIEAMARLHVRQSKPVLEQMADVLQAALDEGGVVLTDPAFKIAAGQHKRYDQLREAAQAVVDTYTVFNDRPMNRLRRELER